MEEFSVSSIFDKSFNVIAQSAWPLIRLIIGQGLLFVLVACAIVVFSMPMWGTIFVIIPMAVLMLLVLVLQVNYVRGVLCIVDYQEVNVTRILTSMNMGIGLRFFLASVCYNVIGFLGLLLLIFPGLYWFLSRGLYTFCLVDQGLDVFGSLACSNTLTQNKLWTLVGLYLVTALVYMIIYAVVAFPVKFLLPQAVEIAQAIVSLAFSPFVMVPWAVAYRVLQPRTKDSVNCDV